MAEFRVLRQCCRSLATSLFCQLLFLLPWVMPLFGQSQTAPASSADVPHFVRFSGTAKDAHGKPLSGTVGVTFALYKEEQGRSPLWLETQNVQADVNGHYTVYLGASKSGGLPQDVFVSGEARWLGVQPEGQAEQSVRCCPVPALAVGTRPRRLVRAAYCWVHWRSRLRRPRAAQGGIAGMSLRNDASCRRPIAQSPQPQGRSISRLQHEYP